MKHIIILGDGMADWPAESLGNKTLLQYSSTPYMDKLAAMGRTGRLITVAPGFHPGSEVANMSVMGYNLPKVYEGRGPLEAASIGVVTLGFLELAFALKFLSVADLAYGWRLLDRETFLALWIVIFALLGFYLLGKIKFPHDDDDDKVGVTRFFMALISLAFAVYMVPGLWGAPLKAVSAFAPPMQTQDFNLYKNEVHAKFDDYDLGMEYARLNGKPVMLDFTGYGCVNCRKMEAAVWTDPKVSDLINNDYVLITLYVDNKTPLTEPVKIIENGTERTLRTVGDKWSYLQRVKFGANAQPFYVLLDNQGKPLNKSYAYNEDIPKYIEFLQTGLENYKKEK